MREETEREQLQKKIDEDNKQAQLRWHELKEKTKFPAGTGDKMRKKLELSIRGEQAELDYKYLQIFDNKYSQEEMTLEKRKIARAMGEEERRQFEKLSAKMKEVQPSSEFKWRDNKPQMFDQPSNYTPCQGPQFPQFQNPNIMSIANNVSVANPQLKIFKRKRREDDVHFVQGCRILDWFQSMENFFATKNITNDNDKIE